MVALLGLICLSACDDQASSPTPLNSTQTLPPAASPPEGVIDGATIKVQTTPLLERLWKTYKDRYLQPDGRVRDPQRNDPTTSEGESYALLRAVYQNDRPTFDSVLNWSISYLQNPRGDKLFAYLWGKSADNIWQVLDRHAATDADQDISYALLLAARKWNEPGYSTQALQILNDLWDKTVVTLNGRPYLTAGDWATAAARPVLNPSYLAPYQYRLYAQLDPVKSHDWPALIDTSYEVIKECTVARLDKDRAGWLPPDWCALDKTTGKFVSALDQGKDFDSNFGYDAFRTVWRLSLDYRWNGEKRALDYLQSLKSLADQWKKNGKVASVYDHVGSSVSTSEDLGIYGGSLLPLLIVLEPGQADRLVVTKLLPQLVSVGQGDDPDPAHSDASTARTYYAQNWVWFGLGLYADVVRPPESLG